MGDTTPDHDQEPKPNPALPVSYSGWAFVGGSRKAHYFRAGETTCLCRGYGFFEGPRYDTFHDSVDNCARCRKLREAESRTGTA